MFNIYKINTNTGDRKELTFKEFLFPAGEVSVKLNAGDYAYQAINLPHTIVARLQTSNDVMKLAMLKDALMRFDPRPVNLFLAYVPYGRQDRVCDAGESFSIAVFARFIASLNFNKVVIVDPHSEVTPAVLEALEVNVKVISQLDVVKKYLDFTNVAKNTLLVSPDAGSNKKVAGVAGYFQHDSFVRADKLRDLTNGKIKEIVVYAYDLRGRDVTIVDDLCSKGGTFIGLAQVLKKKNAGKVILYVTHAELGGDSEAEKVLSNLFTNGIEEIWTTNGYSTKIDELKTRFINLHVLDMEKFLI